MKWIQEYNELFSRINQPDKVSYFSGPRFLNVIREFDPNFIGYSQYIEYRKEKNLSTSRKVYFFDILSMFKDDIRNTIVTRINQIAESSDNAGEIEAVVPITRDDATNAIAIEAEEPLVNTSTFDNPTVFISYSWDSEDHKTWVMNLAIRLIGNGVNVLLDRYDLQGGKNAPVFMENSLRNADKILLIFTPNYKLKADGRQGGVGVEYSIINQGIYLNIANNDKYIPVLRTGAFETSIPDFMRQFIAVDMRDDSQYEDKIRELTLIVYDRPVIARPELGARPDYVV